MNHNITKSVIVLPLLFTTLMLTRIVSVNLMERPLYWPGWYILKLPENKDDRPYTLLLQSLGIKDLLSSSTTTVSWMAVPELENVLVSEIETVLPPGDPRRDPFLQKVGNLFRPDNSFLIYLPVSRRLSDYRRLIADQPLLNDTELLDDVQGRHALPMLVFILLLALIVFLLPEESFISFIAFLPWAMTILFFGRDSVILGFFIFFLVVIRKSSVKWIKWTTLGLIPVVFAILYITLPAHQFFILLITCIESEALLLLLNKLFVSSRLNRQPEHKIFEPVPLVEKNNNEPKKINKKNIYKMLVISALPLISIFIPRADPLNQNIPSVQASTGTYSSISSLYHLFINNNTDYLPNVSDMLASRAFQSDFLNNSRYGLPLPGETLTHNLYRESDNKIQVDEIVITDYNADWYNKTVQTVLSEGVGLLYSTLDGPAPIKMSTPNGVKEVIMPMKLIIPMITAIILCLIIAIQNNYYNSIKQHKLRKVRVA